MSSPPLHAAIALLRNMKPLSHSRPGPDVLLRTFIIEDSPLILESLTETLEETCPVEVVGSAADEAAANHRLAAAASSLDLVIVDVFLRSGSGLGVLRSLRQSGSDVRRIVLTNYPSEDIRNACLELGAERVFDKSTDLDELITYCIGLAETLPGGSNGGGAGAAGH